MSKDILLKNFEPIYAEKLSMNDPVMQYKPITIRERMAMELVEEAINRKVRNFYAPKLDPSFSDEGLICFQTGLMPALGKNYKWWDAVARIYMSEYNSRLGTRLQYGAFIGVLANRLFEEGKNINWIWNALSMDSRELGHYKDSEGAKSTFEVTGSRTICGFSDLANTRKLLVKDEKIEGYWLASGSFRTNGIQCPLTTYQQTQVKNGICRYTTGWIICSESPENFLC